MKFSIVIALLTFLSFTHFCSAQYYLTTVAGNTPKTLNKERVNIQLDEDPEWTTIMGTTTTPMWSSIQTLPFAFKFNGNPVTSYKVSSTGVLTFSTVTTTIPGAIPRALPSALIPNNSICLWGMQPTNDNSFISYKTFGNSGNRQYWVTFSFCSTGTIELSTWSIVLEEGSNNIYIVEQWNGHGSSPALSVGIQINSSLAFSDPLSPSVLKTSGFDFTMADDLYRRFAPGVQPQTDIELIDFKMPYYVTPGNKKIEGTIHNVGQTMISSITVTWNDGSGPITENLDVSIAPNNTYSFICTKEWNAQASPQTLLTLAVTTMADANASNNGYVKPVTVLDTVPKRYIVVEERTGTWCPWCPNGAVGMADLEQEPEYIGIAVHNYDPMEVDIYDLLIGTCIKDVGFPAALIDREIKTGFSGPGYINSRFNERRANVAPCEVKNLSFNIDSSTNEINVSCETEWFGKIRGDYRLSCVIVEDDVIGTTSKWFQANAYAGGGNGTKRFPSHINNGFDFATAANPADPTGFGGYDHVARYLSSDDILGDPNSLPSGEVPMGTYAYTFAPIPDSVINNMNKAQAIVMVVNKYTGEILNANKIPLNCSVLPTIAIVPPSTITCAQTSILINASNSSQGSNFSYQWTTSDGGNIIEGDTTLTPTVNTSGTYTLLLTNTATGCTSTAITTVALNNTQPNASASSTGNLNCNTPQLELSGSGSSTGPIYSYLWTTSNGHFVSGETTLNPIIDVAGTYNLLVTNTENGCSNTASASVGQSPPVTSMITDQTNITCNGASNGNATVVGSGGNGTFTYTWNNGVNASTITNVPAGLYIVTVSDGENCTSSTSVNVTQPDVLTCIISSTSPTSNNVNDGTATAVANGGTSGYTYLWSNGETTSTIIGLAPGIYTVVVTDANGCTALQTVTVNSFNGTTQTNEPTWLKGIQIKPNPTTGLTKIMFAETPVGTMKTQIMNATGRLVWSNVSENQPFITIDATDLSSGIYLIHFCTGAESGTRKLVISR
ncbi:MAG TPA: T9SS type A sorting domain-containing protein [Saprospiraceae bacterium]|nr:T9SS type A sorting domain-containing protein [Saprospiraceae bacterium]